MTDAAKQARREYKREWNRKNRDKVQQAQIRYWERRAAALQQQETKTDDQEADSIINDT